MKGMVIYDSAFGNTRTIADVIANILHIPAVNVQDAKVSDLQHSDIVVVGSPTQGGRPTPKLQEFLKNLPPRSLQGASVAAFDTRFDESSHGFFLRVVMKVLRFAAPRIAKNLQAAGGQLVIAPHGFIVDDKEGPLHEHEIDQARAWAQTISRAMHT